MANPENQGQVSSLPLPPTQYINLYSEENIRRNRAPRPPPIFDVYNMFGVMYNSEEMIRSMESQNIKRLIPIHFDRRKELKKINHSLLSNFLDLIDYLIVNPDSPRRTEKIDDISLLFVHMHHLINEFRPHQARETLRVMMEMQKRQRVETKLRFAKHLERVRSMSNAAFAALPEIIKDEQNNEKNYDAASKGGFGSNKFGHVLPIDRIFCNIADSLY